LEDEELEDSKTRINVRILVVDRKATHPDRSRFSGAGKRDLPGEERGRMRKDFPLLSTLTTPRLTRSGLTYSYSARWRLAKALRRLRSRSHRPAARAKMA